MNLERNLLLILLIVILLSGCSEGGIFKEIKLNSNELENLPVIGFGTGKAFSENMAKIRAKTNAMVNLVDQINGRDFVYEESTGSTNFKSTTKGKLSQTEVVQTYDLGDNSFLTILSTPMQRTDINPKNAFLLETNFRTDNLEKALIEKYKTAVEEMKNRKFKKQSKFSGKIFLSDIALSDFQDKPDFAVSLKVLIVCSKSN
jgi:hypothetical protein